MEFQRTKINMTLVESNKWAISAISVSLAIIAYFVLKLIGTITWWIFILVILALFFSMVGFMQLDWQAV